MFLARAVPLVASLMLSSCATAPVVPQLPPEPQPIAAGKGGSYPVVFQKVLFRIPTGTPLGVTRLRGKVIKETNWDGDAEESSHFNVSATDELRRLGYDVKDASDAVFTPGSTVEARYQIAAIVHALRLEFDLEPDSSNYSLISEESVSRADMEIEFQIFDAVDKKTVSKKRVQGRAIEQGRTGAPMPKALVSGLRQALADAAFVAPLLRNAPASPAAAPAAPQTVPLKRCAIASLQLPAGLSRAQEAVVVVVVGAGGGAGTLVSDDGYVLTAAHVLGAQSSALLRFKSGLELPAEVVRVDSGRDAALLKVPGRGYACLRTESSMAAVGTEIWAIGNPFAEELARSVTRGVVSGNQTIRERTYLQTDAAVNPGNSGGPLLDAAGQLRGIVVEKIWLPGIEGLGFAVPIADAERALGITWQ